MFTGLVQHVGRVLSIQPTSAGSRLVIDPSGWSYRPAPGDSLAVNGCCLTIVACDPAAWAFDVVPETLGKTTLGAWTPGSRVNLEHAATPTTLLGGHLVQGHIDGTAEVIGVQTGRDWRIGVRPPAELGAYFIPKGSVCIDGVSLTLAGVDVAAGTFDVALIPATLGATTLGALRAGDRVNVEADATVKAVVHVLRHFGGTLPTPP